MEICRTAGNVTCPGAAFQASLVTENEGLEILLTLLSDFLGIHLFTNQPGKYETALSPWLLNKFRQLGYSGLFGAEYRPRAADANQLAEQGNKMAEGIQNSIAPLSFQFP